MPRIKLFIPALAGLAIAALPLHFDPATPFGFGDAAAVAKDKGGGNGGRNGNGGGNGGGSSNAGGNGNGKAGERSAQAGKSSGKSAAGGNRASGNVLRSLLGGGSQDKAQARVASKASGKAKTKVKEAEFAALPETMEAPQLKPLKEKKLNAKLGGLNSLNRNFHAYLNSQSPRMALIREFVMASVEQDDALATLEERQGALLTAETDFGLVLTSLEIAPYGDTDVYADPTIDSLTERRQELADIQNDPLQWDPLSQADKDLISAEIGDIDAGLASPEATALGEAETAVDEAQAAVDAGAEAVNDDALREALLAAANKNRADQYSEEDIEEILEWAKGVLGVGEAEGKIDEISDHLAATE